MPSDSDTELNLADVGPFRFSSIKKRGSTVSREVLSGLIIYLSLIYIFIVNPEILSAAGTPADPMPPQAILIATVLTSAFATILMGFAANLPLAVAPGLEVSTFFTFILVRGMHLTWHQALAAVLMSGLLNVVLTAISFRERIIQSIPDGLKASLLLAVGSFIALVGLRISGLVDVSSGGGLARWVFVSDIRGPFIMLLGALLCFTINTERFVLPWGVILAVVICTGASLYLGFVPTVPKTDGYGFGQVLFALDFSKSFTLNFIAGVLILFVIDFVGGVGKIIALTTGTSMQSRDGYVPGLKHALYVDGVSTTLGSLIGTSSLIAFVESRLGIEAGARTGLSAIVCGLMMFTGLLYSGVFRIVPPIATAGILLYIGILLIRVNLDLLKRSDTGLADTIVGILMVIAVLVTFQMDWAMFIGFGLYFCKTFLNPETRKPALWLGGVAGVLGASVLIPLFVSMHH